MSTSRGNATKTLLPELSHAGPADILQLSRDDCRAGRRPRRTARLSTASDLRVTPQAYYYVGSFGALGEYVKVSQDVTRVTPTRACARTIARQHGVAGAVGVVPDRRRRSVQGFTPTSTFSLDNGTWGAFELVARYHELDIDDDAFAGGAEFVRESATAASKASAWGVGLNWYLNQNYKW